MTLPVLFVCDKNAVRSIAAEALFQKKFPEVICHSAGLTPTGQIDPFMAGLLISKGMQIDVDREPQGIAPFPIAQPAHIITLSREAFDFFRSWPERHPETQLDFWEIPTPPNDPFSMAREQALVGYQDILRSLETHIRNSFQ